MEFGKVIKTFKSKKGNEVSFCYPTLANLAEVLTFANALIAEDTFIELSGKPITLKEQEKWLKELLDQVKKKERIHIVVKVKGRYAGNGEVRIGKYRHGHVGNIGIALASPYREEGIGTELLKKLFDEARRAGLRLLTISCYENNPRALHIYEKLGFVRAGTIPGAIKYKNGYVGEVIMYLPLTA